MRSGFVGTVGPTPPRGAGAQTDPPNARGDLGHVLCASDWCWIEARPRPGERFSVSRDALGITLAILGHLIDTFVASDTPASADDLRSELGPDGAFADRVLQRFEGSYQLLVIDEPKRAVRLIGDHLASRPLFHGRAGARIGFGRSEAEALQVLGLEPRLSFEGAAGFLAVGYPLGSHTLTEGVHRQRPARELCVRADGSVRERPWWDLNFGDPAHLRLEDAVEELHALGRASVLQNLADGSPFHLALTGGYDSRLLLALLREGGRLPEAAFTWFHRPEVPGSDPVIARSLAALAGVSHRALRYEPTSFAGHLDAWLRTSALGSDNLGHFCAGESFLADHGLPSLPVVLGDHVLGLGGTFATNTEAISAVLRTPWPNLSPALHALLTPEALERVRESVVEQVTTIATDAQANQPKDLHHYLYFHIGVFGWLLAPGYYKEPVLQARRPLASRALLAAASRWPAEVRHDKRVVVALLRNRYPDLHAVPTADRSALVDWLTAVQDADGAGGVLSGLLTGAALDGGLLAGQIRRDVVAARLAALQRSAPAAPDRRRLRAWGVRLRRSVGHMGATARLLGRVERLLRRASVTTGGPEDDLRHLFRIGLLAAFERRTLAPGVASAAGASPGTEGRP